MGTIIHKAVVVTGSCFGYDTTIMECVEKATDLGLTVLGPSEEVVNGYKTMVVCPHGSKEGWSECIKMDKRRVEFIKFLSSKSVEWAEVKFGWDLEDV